MSRAIKLNTVEKDGQRACELSTYVTYVLVHLVLCYSVVHVTANRRRTIKMGSSSDGKVPK